MLRFLPEYRGWRSFDPLPIRADLCLAAAASLAEALNRGLKVEFPANANALRVSYGTKTTVILKADADTLKGAGVASAVEFGVVRNDSQGHPLRKGFASI